VKFLPPWWVEQLQDCFKVDEEGIAAKPSKEGTGAGLDDVRRGPEGDLGFGDDLLADGFW
jgi:hypothetical protein